MNNKIKKVLYYLIILLLFLTIDHLVLLFKLNDKKGLENSISFYENADLKEEIEKLSQLKYHDYDYVLGKISVKKLYSRDTYFINVPYTISDNLPVINNTGFIGLYSNHYLIPAKDLTLSIKVNNQNGILTNGHINISHGDYQVGDNIYTSGLTNIPENLLIGKINKVNSLETGVTDDLSIEYIENSSTYVGILINYA